MCSDIKFLTYFFSAAIAAGSCSFSACVVPKYCQAFLKKTNKISVYLYLSVAINKIKLILCQSPVHVGCLFALQPQTVTQHLECLPQITYQVQLGMGPGDQSKDSHPQIHRPFANENLIKLPMLSEINIW